ncbi:MAG: SAM-dependent chlorinase/fluorinase [Thermoplasmata archaeon]
MTLSTDVGWPYAAQMKAALAAYLPPGSLVDLAHDLPAHGIGEAGFLLRHMAGDFPPGTIHVAVVDPGVGGSRAAVVVQCREGSYLVGPDNGLLAPLAAHLGIRRTFRLQPELVRPGRAPSATFEGRDVFAPAAGQLACGVDPSHLGRPVRLTQPPSRSPHRSATSLHGRVVHVDRFGNLITSLPTGWLAGSRDRVRLKVGRKVHGLARLVRTYADLRKGELGLLGSSFGVLEVAVREGRAADRFRVGVGSSIQLNLSREKHRG